MEKGYIALGTSKHDINLKFVSAFHFMKWWQMKTSLTGSCDWCIIYIPESHFCQHQQNKSGAANIFINTLENFKFIRGDGMVGGGGYD